MLWVSSTCIIGWSLMLNKPFLGTCRYSRHNTTHKYFKGSQSICTLVGWLFIGSSSSIFCCHYEKQLLAVLPPCDHNPICHLWRRQLGSNGILKDQISKYVKLVENSIVITLRSIKDEQTFSTLSYQDQVKKPSHNSFGFGNQKIFPIF